MPVKIRTRKSAVKASRGVRRRKIGQPGKQRPSERLSTQQRHQGTVEGGKSVTADAISGSSADSVAEITVTIRTKEGTAFTLRTSEYLRRAAQQWTYVLRNRSRWEAQESLRNEQSRRSLRLFDELDISPGTMRQLAESDVVEVSIPFTQESVGWEARIFPWEYLLTAATREYRNNRPMIVVRHLDDGKGGSAHQLRTPERVLYVESAPAGLSELFNFASERTLVKSNLNLKSHRDLLTPSASRLREEVVHFKPDVIHLAGVDSHQAVRLIGESAASNELLDGYVMAGERSLFEAINAEHLAGVLNATSHRPALVSANFYNSGARICALAVAGGADAAIGFQDEFNDAHTEFFFTNFYHTWRLSGWNTLEAFRLTCTTLRTQGGLYGTGVILWSARTLVGQQSPVVTAQRRRRSKTSAALVGSELEKQVQMDKAKDLNPNNIGKDKLSETLQVIVKPYDSLNYSMLHNNRPLFDTFRISKPGPGTVRGIKVKTVLYAGATNFPYELTIDMDQSPLDLRDAIRVPLIYSMGPAISESVHTSLYTCVTWGDHELYSNTHRVTLLPLDEWRDDDTERVWLPSFVLPRDRSVNRVVDAGQRYLWALADNSSAGFDGYQSVEEDTKPGELITDGVDLQVQALWAALAFEMNLGYINPPPSYNLASQRVRTPSEVIEGHRGTCIDLALLMATCCEYIEVYPVIFLLDGHAFPGYWRSDRYHQEFTEMANSSAATAIATKTRNQPQQTPLGTAQRFPWYLDNSFYAEVVQQVRDRKLVPIESTMIAQRGSFWEAVDAGIENLRSKRQFHSLIDVRLARDNRVTPIPLRGRPE
jgi:hypothetical protein